MSGKDPRPHGILRTSPHAAALRDAGLRVTSARLAMLRMAPAVLEVHGHLSPQLLREAAYQHGYVFSPTVFRHVLPRLTAAGLLPAPAAAGRAETPHDTTPLCRAPHHPEQ